MRGPTVWYEHADISCAVCVGQNIARLELLQSVARFFKEFPNAELAESVTTETTSFLDFFVIKMKGGSLEIVLK